MGTDLLLNAALSLLRDSADGIGARFSSVGVALDWTPSAGIGWLKGIADFDEIIAGREWVNLGAIAYVWRDSSAVPALPQLVVLARTVRLENNRIVASQPQPILRLLGEQAIRAWVEAHRRHH